MDRSGSHALQTQAWIHFLIALITGGAAVAFFHPWYGYYNELWAQYPYQTISVTLLAIVAITAFSEFLSLYLRAKVPTKQVKRDGSEPYLYAALTIFTIAAGISYYTVSAQFMGVEWRAYPIRPVLFIALVPTAVYFFAKFLHELVEKERRQLTSSDDTAFAPEPTAVPLT